MAQTTPPTSGGNGGLGGTGLESVIWHGRGEPGSGQPNEHAGELQNYWLRVDRIAESDTPPLASDIYGRLDFRYNGTDAVLYSAVYDNGGDHRIDTFLDFGMGKFTQVHGDTLETSDEKGYWYLSSANDQRFLSLDARDASFWINNQIDDYYFLVHQKKLVVANQGESTFCQLDATDGSAWIYGGGHEHGMGGGTVYGSDMGHANYAALGGADGSVYCFSPAYSQIMRAGIISTSNSAGTSYAALNATDGSIYAYDATGYNFLYRRGDLKLYSSNFATTIELQVLSTASSFEMFSPDSASHAEMIVSNSQVAFQMLDASGAGLNYNSTVGNFSVLNGTGGVGQYAAATASLNDGSHTGTWWPSGLTLTNGTGTVSIDCSDFTGTMSAQQVTLCVDGVSKTAYFLMTTPA